MVSYAYLNEADFSKLADSAESWKLLKKKYDGIGDQFDEQVVKRLAKTWDGEAASKANGHMKKAITQYENAGIEAHRLGKLMADAHDDFISAQKKLHTLQDEAATEHFKIHDTTGSIEDVHPNWQSPTASSQPGWGEERREKQEGYARHLKKILHHATQLDQGYSAALKADFNGDENKAFDKSGYSSDNKALRAQKDADKAARLMDKDERLTGTELDQLDKILTTHKGDPAFAARFAEKAGVKNTLDTYDQIIDPPPGTDISDAQRKRIASLHKHLGSTLGTATRVDSAAMDKFNRDLLHAVHSDYTPGPNKNSFSGLSVYQLTSSLMSEGNWDDDLVKDYGHQIITKENGVFAGKPDAFWSMHQGSSDTGLPPLDPMTGFMDALGNNPDASLEFLNGDTKISDGKTVDNLDYLMKDRDWPEGVGFTGDDKHEKGIYTLGHALESATTGVPYDYDGVTMPEHTREQAHLVNELITKISDPNNVDAIDGDKGHLAPLKGSLGDITANYMGDFQRVFGPHDLPINGAPVGNADGISLGDARIFLREVGQDPEAYKAISAAQQGYTRGLIDETLAHNEPGVDSSETQNRVANVTTPGTNIAGIMSEARADAVVGKQIAEDKEYNSTVDEVNKWVGRGAGIATGTIASPAAGTAVNIGYQELSQGVVEHLHQDHAKRADLEAITTYSSGEQSHRAAVESAIKASARAHGYNASQAGDIVDTVNRETGQSFGSAAAGVHPRR